MQIKLNSVFVDNQEKALKFYTEVLGFVKKFDMPMGEFRWLTVVSPDGPGDLELVLEPMGFPPAKTFQAALFAAGIPLTALETKDIRADYLRLKTLGVVFRGEPQQTGPVRTALFEDTCGNLINLYQV
jgi:catechol 2,3-dioxygenase-like lactoylglutathione lyase family enzyme